MSNETSKPEGAKGKTLIPNSFQHPNAYVDWLSYYLTGEEEKVLNKAIREILGWYTKIEDRRAKIALSVFTGGKTVGGQQVCLGCGLSTDAVRNALASLHDLNILIKIGKPTRDGQEYELVGGWDEIKWDALRQRREEWDSANRKRTKSARGASAEWRKETYGTDDNIRERVFERDGGLCRYCGEVADTIDHIVPTCYGGKSSMENCVCACTPCNNKKWTRTLEEAGMELLPEPTVRQKAAYCPTEGKEGVSDSNKETQASLETHKKPSFPAPDGDGAPLKEGEDGQGRDDLSDVSHDQGRSGKGHGAAGSGGGEAEPDAGLEVGRRGAGGRDSAPVRGPVAEGERRATGATGTPGGASGKAVLESSRPPSRQVNSVIHNLLSSTLTEGGGGSGRERNKWEIPETPEQVDFLAVCGAKWFKPKQKSKVKAIVTALRAGAVAGDDVYQKCMDAIADKAELDSPLPPLPQSWYEWRAPQAKTHRWSVDGFINALLNRDGLMAHCQYHLKAKGAPAANDYGPDPFLMDMPGGGNGKQSASAGKPHRQNVWDKPGYYDDSAN